MQKIISVGYGVIIAKLLYQ